MAGGAQAPLPASDPGKIWFNGNDGYVQVPERARDKLIAMHPHLKSQQVDPNGLSLPNSTEDDRERAKVALSRQSVLDAPAMSNGGRRGNDGRSEPAPVPAATRAAAPEPPATTTNAQQEVVLHVTVPPGVQVGQHLRVEAPDGRVVTVAVPAGVPAGASLQVTIPALDLPQPAELPSQPEPQPAPQPPPPTPTQTPPPPQPQPLTPTPTEDQLSPTSDTHDTLTIVVPENVTAGQQIKVQTPDNRTMVIQVPSGAQPGQSIRIQLPKQVPAASMPLEAEAGGVAAAAAAAAAAASAAAGETAVSNGVAPQPSSTTTAAEQHHESSIPMLAEEGPDDGTSDLLREQARQNTITKPPALPPPATEHCTLPEPAAAATTACPAGAEPAGAAGGTPELVPTESSADLETAFAITIPPGVQPGQRIRVVSPTGRQLVIEVPSHVASGEQIVVTVPADGGGSSAAAGAVPEANSHPQAAASQNVTMMRQAQQQQQEQEQEQAAAAAAAAAPRAAAPVAKWGKMRIDGSPSTRGHWQDAHPSAIPASDPEAMESDRAGFDWEGRGGAAAGAAGQGPGGGGGGRNLRPLPPLGAGKVWYRRSDCLLLQVTPTQRDAVIANLRLQDEPVAEQIDDDGAPLPENPPTHPHPPQGSAPNPDEACCIL